MTYQKQLNALRKQYAYDIGYYTQRHYLAKQQGDTKAMQRFESKVNDATLEFERRLKVINSE